MAKKFDISSVCKQAELRYPKKHLDVSELIEYYEPKKEGRQIWIKSNDNVRPDSKIIKDGILFSVRKVTQHQHGLLFVELD